MTIPSILIFLSVELSVGYVVLFGRRFRDERIKAITLRIAISIAALMVVGSFLAIRFLADIETPGESTMKACYVTPRPVVVDVNNPATLEVVIKVDGTGCATVSKDAEGRNIQVTHMVKMQLSGGAFNGQVTPIGAETQPLDVNRPEARWKWTIKPEIPGDYALTIVATAQEPDGQLYLQDMQSAVHVHVNATLGYRFSRLGKWLKEAVETIQIIIGGAVVITGALGASLVVVRRRTSKSEENRVPPRRRSDLRISPRRSPLRKRR